MQEKLGSNHPNRQRIFRPSHEGIAMGSRNKTSKALQGFWNSVHGTHAHHEQCQPSIRKGTVQRNQRTQYRLKQAGSPVVYYS